MSYVNTFQPQSPISQGLFVGRRPEIQRLESVLRHAKAHRPINFMITGERGIGKTSLMHYLMGMARSFGDFEHDSHNFLIADVVIDKTTTTLDLVKKVEFSLRKELERTERGRAFLGKA